VYFGSCILHGVWLIHIFLYDVNVVSARCAMITLVAEHCGNAGLIIADSELYNCLSPNVVFSRDKIMMCNMNRSGESLLIILIDHF